MTMKMRMVLIGGVARSFPGSCAKQPATLSMTMRRVLIGGVSRSFPGSRVKQPATNIDVDEDGGDDDDDFVDEKVFVVFLVHELVD